MERATVDVLDMGAIGNFFHPNPAAAPFSFFFFYLALEASMRTDNKDDNGKQRAVR
jgi:hypothetical protein